MTRIKICGIREPEHALVAAEEGADYIGVIFAPMSSRKVTPQQARKVAEALHRHLDYQFRPLLVGIFVNEGPEVINHLAYFCGLDLLQLSGDEPWGLCQALTRPAIKALRIPAHTAPEDLTGELKRELPRVQREGGLCLLEGHIEGLYGGTGKRLDWDLAARVAEHHPFLLSGGLNPANVAEAIGQVRPWGVDVSSGVETNGVKDPEKVRAFIRAVKAADAA